ncbi:MAG: hypothetical protein Q7R22_015505 [Verrucomicrobiota bacterium JB025]|nr:hypothetical protein [Verrucomicrobiota bacterium JB025]
MKPTHPLILAALVLSAANSSAITTLSGDVFDLDDDATWTNGVPSESGDPDGQIDGEYNFDEFGDTNVNGNFNVSGLGVVSITQISGDGIGGQFNPYSNLDFTFNLNGGSMTSDGGVFFVNGTNFNVAGGALNALEMRLSNGGVMTVSSGSLTAGIISLRGGTFSQTGGTVTSDHGGPVFNRANTATTLNLTGGEIIAGTGNNNSLINNTGLVTTIGGTLTANLPGAVELFSNGIHENTSSINFTSDWTGSLTLDAATAWDDVFESGDVSVNGVELGPDDFETYFVNSSGVITMIPTTSITITASGFDGSGNYFIDVAEGVSGLKVTTSPDLVTPFTDAAGVTDDGANRFTIAAGSLDGNGDGKDFFRVETE